MKCVKDMILASLSSLALFCYAGNWSAAESNRVARSLVARYFNATFVGDNFGEGPWSTPSWAEPGRLFENPDIPGWTASDLNAAFDGFLGAIATNDCTNLDCIERVALYNSAIEWCDVSNYTNACGPMRTMLLNPKGIHDNLAVAQIAVKFGGVDDEATRFVETIVTNRAAYHRGIVSEVNDLYVDKVIAADTSTPEALAARNRAVEMFYRTRGDVDRAWGVDEVLAACLPRYAVSSNRLAFLESAIDSTNCYPGARERFIGITNELHQTGGPLLHRTLKFYDWEE